MTDLLDAAAMNVAAPAIQHGPGAYDARFRWIGISCRRSLILRSAAVGPPVHPAVQGRPSHSPPAGHPVCVGHPVCAGRPVPTWASSCSRRNRTS